jgi:thiol-disulfide isomerase/thioredoxin
MKKLILTTLAAAGLSLGASAQLQNYSVGQTAPDFTVTDAHGVTHNLYSETAQGKYVFLDFFFTTCPPCQATTPYFSELHEKYGCNGHDLFSISLDIGDNNAEVLAFEAQYGGTHAPAPAVSGTEGGGNAVNSTYGPAAYPTYVLIGPDNKFINIDVWPVSSVASFEGAFPSGSGITANSCAVVAVTPAQAAIPVGISPNPASSAAKLSLNFPTDGAASIDVFDLAGARVAQVNLGIVKSGAREQALDVSALSAGAYLVKVSQEGATTGTARLNVVH